MNLPLDQRPVMVALAGPNGAGKSTFFRAHLRPAGLRFINADDLAHELEMEAYAAARLAGELRLRLAEMGESFVFETVFSDPAGEKLSFLREAERKGYTVVLCFIGISSPKVSEERVSMRVLQGGHDVPTEKLVGRFPRILANLETAIGELPHVWIFDNDDLRTPFRLAARFENGKLLEFKEPIPKWLQPMMAKKKKTAPRS